MYKHFGEKGRRVIAIVTTSIKGKLKKKYNNIYDVQHCRDKDCIPNKIYIVLK